MNVAEVLNEGLTRAYVVRIPAADIRARIDRAVAQVAPQVRLPGFRPGKVPANLIRRMHGAALMDEAVREAVDEAIKALVAERGLRPAVPPSVDIARPPADGEDVEVAVRLEVLPQVPEVPIDGIPLERLIVDVSEDEVERALAELARQQRRLVDAPSDRAARWGDLVVIDFAGTIEGASFPQGSGEGVEVELGSGRLIPGFEEALEGATAGEVRRLRLTIPADHPTREIAGREADFEVTVRAVRVAEVPPVDDRLAANLGLSDLAQLREILKERIKGELERLSRTYLKRKLLDHLAAACDFAVPQSMVEAEFAQIWRQLTEGASEEEKARAEAERADYRRIAERRVRLGLLLSDIGQRHGIGVSASEMNRLIEAEAARYPGHEAQVRRFFAENAMAAAQLRAPLFEEKVVDFLIARAAMSERRVTRAELEAAIASEDETPVAARPTLAEPGPPPAGPGELGPSPAGGASTAS
ncbi:MAG: trigger factor [Sphingomonadaceae bacterium]|uniref:trigger factor n=1 Tax=Thermaurantiacus sp. TaxID=2820283 RepID=UPI00298F27D8|nr:trigger factor [Thermaurantiacus sp.]MCS6986381.1 trigger factor [Sphingomonadaceae bacterium]MDW8414357.1 trigger factor [Thermaurantiacus sp.]